jgi:hypothetical protein
MAPASGKRLRLRDDICGWLPGLAPALIGDFGTQSRRQLDKRTRAVSHDTLARGTTAHRMGVDRRLEQRRVDTRFKLSKYYPRTEPSVEN